ncbi:MAG TPA: methylthioribulose 1-phosphate dehydratase [Blastocatellia bacterium]|nr:methylthioribulose 1-phosphate dehydratase [Blastocatellia bacterium]
MVYADISPLLPEFAEKLTAIGQNFYRRGWVLGTSGNFSAVINRTPLYLAITSSGRDKGALTTDQILQIDATGNVIAGEGKPSDETKLHLAAVKLRGAGAVLHTHSVWSTLLSQNVFAGADGIAISGYEMLKGLAGVKTHDHTEWLPIIENSQQMDELAAAVTETLQRFPDAHGFLLRGHGLYTWGQNLQEAQRHIEIFEFLLEITARTFSTTPGAVATG